ncbi:MAG: type II secretion system protein [Patescibacteria group bacterium]|jgi:type II secretory pathway pseudopilin PulG
MKIFKSRQAFSLLQLIVVMTILIVLAAATFIWIDPLAQVGKTKNQTRVQDVNILAAALSDYANDHGGALPILGKLNQTYKRVLCTSQSGSNLTCDGDSRLCLLVDDNDFYKYINTLPVDPDKSSTADTGYYLKKDSNGLLVVGACTSYNSEIINKTTSIKASCPAYGGGHCWYVYSASNTTCDNICENYAKLKCVEGASYGPDVDSNGDPFCLLNQEILIEITCPGGCTANATGTAPWLAAGNSCAMQKTVVTCSQLSGSGKIPICACE